MRTRSELIYRGVSRAQVPSHVTSLPDADARDTDYRICRSLPATAGSLLGSFPEFFSFSVLFFASLSLMSRQEEPIDVDAWKPSSPVREDDDSEIEFLGFVRTQMPGFKQDELDDDGFTYTGFDKRSTRPAPRPGAVNRPRNRRRLVPRASSSRTTTASVGSPDYIEISDSEDEDQGPPAKVSYNFT